MKHFFKRVNRGIVLGVVLLIGLAVFIWQDEVGFQKETTAIEHTATSYMEAMGKVNTFDTDFQKIGATMTTAQQTDKLQEITKIIDQYWAESDSQNGMSKSSVLVDLKDMVTQNSKGKGYIQKFSAKLEGTPTVKKTGPSSASATTSYTVVLEYAGSPRAFLGGYSESMSNFSGGGKEPSTDTTAIATRKRLTINIQTNYELERIGGTWKIVTTNGGGGSNGGPVDIE